MNHTPISKKLNPKLALRCVEAFNYGTANIHHYFNHKILSIIVELSKQESGLSLISLSHKVGIDIDLTAHLVLELEKNAGDRSSLVQSHYHDNDGQRIDFVTLSEEGRQVLSRFNAILEETGYGTLISNVA